MPTDPAPLFAALTLPDDIDPITKAERIEDWMQTYERNALQAAKHLDVSRATIDNYRLLLKASDELKARLRSRGITMYKALAEMKSTPIAETPTNNPEPTAPAADSPTEHSLTLNPIVKETPAPAPIEDLTPEPIVAHDAPAALLKVRISDLESRLEWATHHLEKTRAQLETAEDEIRRLHAQLETAPRAAPAIHIYGGIFHFGGAS